MIADYAKTDRAAFIRTVQEAQVNQQDSDIKKNRLRLAAAQKRTGELERLMRKIYEDNALGRLPDARYAVLDAQYAKEQDALSKEITELEKSVKGYDQGQKSAEKFILPFGGWQRTGGDLSTARACACVSHAVKANGPHAFRRSMDRRLLEAGVPAPMICDILGHASADSPRQYTVSSLKCLKQCVRTISSIPVIQEELV